MNRYLFWNAVSLLLCGPALAETPEPAMESSPIATIVFIALFVAFCVGFAWLVWRNKGDKKG